MDKLRYLTPTKDDYKSMKFDPKISLEFLEGDEPTLTITDTGIGMSKKELEDNPELLQGLVQRIFIKAFRRCKEGFTVNWPVWCWVLLKLYGCR